jgi:aspartate/tyrosine/aromatic aminotransferase
MRPPPFGPPPQALSGTGALRVGGEFLSKFYQTKHVFIPQPTWANHRHVFERCGLKVDTYRYYKPETRGLDYEVRGWVWMWVWDEGP